MRVLEEKRRASLKGDLAISAAAERITSWKKEWFANGGGSFYYQNTTYLALKSAKDEEVGKRDKALVKKE